MSTIVKIEVPIPFPVIPVNCYYIRDSIPTLIDAGPNGDEFFALLSQAIAGAGDSIRDLRRIVITHRHVDHLGLAGRIADESGAEVFVHSWDGFTGWGGFDGFVKARRQQLLTWLSEAGLHPDLIGPLVQEVVNSITTYAGPIHIEKGLLGGEVLAFDDFELSVIHTPGHSPGSICLFNEMDGSLFTGDTLFDIFLDPAATPPGSPCAHHPNWIAAHRESLMFLASLSTKKVYPGHGEPYSDCELRLSQIEAHHQRMSEHILQILREHTSESGYAAGITEAMVAEKLLGDLQGRGFFRSLCSARLYLRALLSDGTAVADLGRYPFSYRIADKAATPPHV